VRNQIAQLEAQASASDFWSRPQQAQETLQHLAALKAQVEPWDALRARAKALEDLLALALQEDDESVALAAEGEMQQLEAELDRVETQALLSGPYDRHNALLTINSGAGGTDAQDWAEMLLRMYVRWATEHQMEVRVLDRTEGEEAGLASATAEIRGAYAYGYLKGETGIHRLVRISPFDANRRRHTSFASVEVLPEMEEQKEVEIEADDLRIDTFRSSGAGGQHVNKTDSAVRITHLPTGIVVQCQNERSQHQNREVAMRILRSRLADLQRRQQEQQLAQLRGEQADISWGNQMRSYFLHPYTLVKDHRTQVEIGDAHGVLGGAIDPFLQAFLRQQAASRQARGTSAAASPTTRRAR